jgi:hypothetical protein
MGAISDAAYDHSLMAIQSLTLALRLPAHSNGLTYEALGLIDMM